jgi:putative transposase
MLIQINPTMSLAKTVQILKGGTSIVIRSEFPELEEFLWGDSFWANGYFSETIGIQDEKMIRRYVKE